MQDARGARSDRARLEAARHASEGRWPDLGEEPGGCRPTTETPSAPDGAALQLKTLFDFAGCTIRPGCFQGAPQAPSGLLDCSFGLLNQHLCLVTQLATFLHQMPRRFSQRLCPAPHFGRQHRTTVEVSTNYFGEVSATAGAEVRTTTEKICGHLAKAEAPSADFTSSDRVVRAIVEEEGALIASQRLGPLTVHVRQAIATREDAVTGLDRPIT